MKNMNFAARAAVITLSAIWLSNSALAFCGVVEASATAPTKNQAINLANKAGLKETNKLDRKYGGDVDYDRAKVNCKTKKSSKVSCKITQSFCVNGSPNQSTGNGEEQVDPNSPACKNLARKCNNGEGNLAACGDFENFCQND